LFILRNGKNVLSRAPFGFSQKVLQTNFVPLSPFLNRQISLILVIILPIPNPPQIRDATSHAGRLNELAYEERSIEQAERNENERRRHFHPLDRSVIHLTATYPKHLCMGVPQNFDG
jgi:hypothetical protein